MRNKLLSLCALLLFALAPNTGGAQLVGPGVSGNSFPFTGTQGGIGTIYQQVYAASNFVGAGFLNSVSFFEVGEVTLRSGTYDLFASTTSTAVNGLSTSNFDGNRGANNVLFASMALSGASPAILTFLGGPFFYDPTAGNLLLDFRISNIGVSGNGVFKADNGTAGGVYSRAHNFGLAFENYGLQTQFNFTPAVAVVPEPATFALVGVGLLVVMGIGRRRNLA